MPKYYLYHKIEVKNTEEKYIPDINNNEIEKLKNKNNFSNNILNIDSFGLGESIYKNKTLSILGDSLSTFNGYLPEGNPHYCREEG